MPDMGMFHHKRHEAEMERAACQSGESKGCHAGRASQDTFSAVRRRGVNLG